MNIGKTLSDAIRQHAPTVAGAVLNEIPGGKIVREVSKAVLGRDDAPPDLLADALREPTPETLEALESLEKEYTERLKIDAADRADARAMAEVTNDPTARRLAYLDTALVVVAVVGVMVFSPDNDFVQTIVSAAIGALLANMRQARDFLMGSSMGSKIKTVAMSRK